MKRTFRWADGRFGALLVMVALGGLACSGACGGKKSSTESDGNYKDIAKTFDDSEPPPDQRKPVEAQDLGKLSDVDKQRFEKLVDSLPSPCGKAHSLRTSRNNDAECVRSRFAVDYVSALIADGATDDDVRELYAARYKKDEPKRGFRLSEAVPHRGPSDGRVVLVEFYDYGCPSCREFAPQLTEVAEAYPNDVVIYYKQFPLAAHEHSKGAAQAALAAAKQGKFEEMHKKLFDASQSHAHRREDLFRYAKELGLDMAKFEADYAAAESQVNAEKKEGEDAGVQGTPTVYINGRQFEGPPWAKYLKMWIEEELAVNR